MDYGKIPEVYPGKFPPDFREGFEGWNFTEEDLEKNRGKVLTLDIDFGNSCMLNCPHCFRRDGNLDKRRESELGYGEMVDVIKHAKKLGLRSVKFLGAGEPLQEKRLLEFLCFLKSLDVIPLIFTKGHIIGDDKLARRYHGHEGVRNGQDLAERLKECTTSILLGFRSFDCEKEDRMVGITDYAKKRNRALKLLVDAGFNRSNPTKMGLMPLPVTKDNVGEVFEIYKYARRRNMGIIVTPPMVSGRCSRESYRKDIDISHEQKVGLYAKIYKWNIEKGLQTPEQIRKEGISSYAGTFPCQQIGCGMYVTLDGTVLRCPGDDTTVFGNVKMSSVKEIWKKCENFKRAGTFNCGCPPKAGKTIAHGFYGEVMEKIFPKNA